MASTYSEDELWLSWLRSKVSPALKSAACLDEAAVHGSLSAADVSVSPPSDLTLKQPQALSSEPMGQTRSNMFRVSWFINRTIISEGPAWVYLHTGKNTLMLTV